MSGVPLYVCYSDKFTVKSHGVWNMPETSDTSQLMIHAALRLHLQTLRCITTRTVTITPPPYAAMSSQVVWFISLAFTANVKGRLWPRSRLLHPWVAFLFFYDKLSGWGQYKIMPLTWMLRCLNKEETGWRGEYLRINDLMTKPVKANWHMWKMTQWKSPASSYHTTL